MGRGSLPSGVRNAPSKIIFWLCLGPADARFIISMPICVLWLLAGTGDRTTAGSRIIAARTGESPPTRPRSPLSVPALAYISLCSQRGHYTRASAPWCSPLYRTKLPSSIDAQSLNKNIKAPAGQPLKPLPVSIHSAEVDWTVDIGAVV